MVPVNDWTMTTMGSKRVSVTGLGDKRDTFFSNTCPFLNWLYTSTVDFVLLPKKDTKKSTIEKRLGQITPMSDPQTTRANCCTKPNWIGSSRLWNNRPRPHSLGLLGYIFAGRKKSREDIFGGGGIIAGRYFRVNSNSRKYLLAKIFKIHFSRRFPPAKIKCKAVLFLSCSVPPSLWCSHPSQSSHALSIFSVLQRLFEDPHNPKPFPINNRSDA